MKCEGKHLRFTGSFGNRFFGATHSPIWGSCSNFKHSLHFFVLVEFGGSTVHIPCYFVCQFKICLLKSSNNSLLVCIYYNGLQFMCKLSYELCMKNYLIVNYLAFRYFFLQFIISNVLNFVMK